MSGAPAEVSLYYYRNDGSPASLLINSIIVDHTVVTVPGNGMQEVEPDWSGPETSVWAGIVYANPGIKVQGVFLWHAPGDPADKYTEAAAPVISQTGGCIIPMPGISGYSMPFDQTSGRFNGYAFANTTSTPVTINLELYDDAGQQLGYYTESLPGFGHSSLLLQDKVPAVAGKRGRLNISGTGIIPLGFRFTPYYTFTTWQP